MEAANCDLKKRSNGMKIVLKEDVNRLGKKGDVVDVASGYGRNFLLPKKIAIIAEEANLEAIKRAAIREMKKKEEEERKTAELSEKIKKVSLSIPMKAGDDDKLYGSVGEDEIAAALEKEGIIIDKKKIMLEEPIKLLGVYNVPVKVSVNVSVPIKIWVVKE